MPLLLALLLLYAIPGHAQECPKACISRNDIFDGDVRGPFNKLLLKVAPSTASISIDYSTAALDAARIAYTDVSNTFALDQYILGKLGIGTVSPQYTLDVNGLSYFKNDVVAVTSVTANNFIAGGMGAAKYRFAGFENIGLLLFNAQAPGGVWTTDISTRVGAVVDLRSDDYGITNHTLMQWTQISTPTVATIPLMTFNFNTGQMFLGTNYYSGGKKLNVWGGINTTEGFYLNAENINTGGTLSNVAYKDQANTFTKNQTISQSAASSNLNITSTLNSGYARTYLTSDAGSAALQLMGSTFGTGALRNRLELITTLSTGHINIINSNDTNGTVNFMDSSRVAHAWINTVNGNFTSSGTITAVGNVISQSSATANVFCFKSGACTTSWGGSSQDFDINDTTGTYITRPIVVSSAPVGAYGFAATGAVKDLYRVSWSSQTVTAHTTIYSTSTTETIDLYPNGNYNITLTEAYVPEGRHIRLRYPYNGSNTNFLTIYSSSTKIDYLAMGEIKDYDYRHYTTSNIRWMNRDEQVNSNLLFGNYSYYSASSNGYSTILGSDIIGGALSVTAVGSNIQASGAASVALGRGCKTAGSYQIALGYNANLVPNQEGVISVGANSNNNSAGYYSLALGANVSTTGKYAVHLGSALQTSTNSDEPLQGAVSHTAYTGRGDAAQPMWRNFWLSTATVNGSTTELFLDEASARIILKAKSVLSFSANCVALSTGTYQTYQAMVNGLITRDASNNTTLISSSTISGGGTISGASISIAANDAVDALTATATGGTTEQVYWTCKFDTQEVRGP